jgi:hypothetical protein
LEFRYTKKELSSYLAWRTAGLTYKSSIWLAKAASVFWEYTKGTISKDSLQGMREALFSKYDASYSHGKVLNFTKGFLRYQAKLTFDQRLFAFDLFLEKPKVRKTRKKVTARIITKTDVENVLL